MSKHALPTPVDIRGPVPLIPPGLPVPQIDDLAWAKEAEPILDTHLGEGSRVFRADNLRDNDGKLMPAPSGACGKCT